jgi:ribosome recycling factor
MSDDVMQGILTSVNDEMEKAIQSLTADLQKVRTGRASTHILNDVRVEYYGDRVPLSQIATLAAPEGNLLTINPFDKSTLTLIEKAILSAGIDLTPNNDGKIIRLPIPPLSEERRKTIVKQVKELGEEAKVSIRRHRQEGNERAKAAEDAKKISEDTAFIAKERIQKATDGFIKKVDTLCEAKEEEILTLGGGSSAGTKKK